MRKVWDRNLTTVCSSSLHRTGGPVAMAMQYFSRIAHIDSHRRQRPSRSEKKMCVCVLGDGMWKKRKERESVGWSRLTRQWLVLLYTTHDTTDTHVTPCNSTGWPLHSYISGLLVFWSCSRVILEFPVTSGYTYCIIFEYVCAFSNAIVYT